MKESTRFQPESLPYFVLTLKPDSALRDVLDVLPTSMVDCVQMNVFEKPHVLKVALTKDATPANADVVRVALEPFALGAPEFRIDLHCPTMTIYPPAPRGSSSDAAQA